MSPTCSPRSTRAPACMTIASAGASSDARHEKQPASRQTSVDGIDAATEIPDLRDPRGDVAERCRVARAALLLSGPRRLWRAAQSVRILDARAAWRVRVRRAVAGRMDLDHAHHAV